MEGHRLPARPRLRPYLRSLVLGPDKMLIKGGTSTVVLRGSSVEEVAAVLLPALDGSRTVEDVVAAFDWIEPAVALEALELFDANGLLEDAAASPSGMSVAEAERYRHQSTFWLSVAGDRYGTQELLSRASVVVFGLGGVGSTVASSLAAAGVGRLVLVDGGGVDPADALFGFTGRHAGTSRAWAVKDHVKEVNDHVVTDVADTGDESPSTIAAALEGSDLGIFCSDASSLSACDAGSDELCDSLNRASLDCGVPWTRAVVDHQRGIVGPSVIPRQTPCLTCFRLRLFSNLAFDEEALAYERSLPHPDAAVEPAVLGPFAGLVGHFASIEAIKLVTQFARPASAGACVTLNSLTGQVTRHEVLKLPRCPDCGPTRDRPQMKIWDIGEPG